MPALTAPAAQRKLHIEAGIDLKCRNALAIADCRILRFDEEIEDPAVGQCEGPSEADADGHHRGAVREVERHDAARAQVIAVGEIVEEQGLQLDRLRLAVERLLVGDEACGQAPMVARAHDALATQLPLRVAQRGARRRRRHRQRPDADPDIVDRMDEEIEDRDIADAGRRPVRPPGAGHHRQRYAGELRQAERFVR